MIDRILKKAYTASAKKEKSIIGPDGKPFDATVANVQISVGKGKTETVPNPAFETEQINQEITTISKYLSRQLAIPRAQRFAVDFTDMAIWNANFAGVKFGKAHLSNLTFVNNSMKGSDLSEVVNFNDSLWGLSDWWKAAKIDRKLLEYLKATFPMQDDHQYVGGNVTRAQYDSLVAALGSGEGGK